MENQILSMILPWMREVGLPGVILIIWYFDHRRISEIENFSDTYRRLATEAGEREKSLLEAIQMNVACLSRLEQKINDNIFCPVVRKERGQ